jgi:hypothetical protein
MESERIWLGLWPNARTTRVVAMRGASETILKATLPLRPSNIRAATALLEAIALWEGRPVRAVLVADESSTSSCSTTLYRDTFAIFGERTGLYELEWVSRAPARRHRDALGGMGSFGALERLLLRTVVR